MRVETQLALINHLRLLLHMRNLAYGDPCKQNTEEGY